MQVLRKTFRSLDPVMVATAALVVAALIAAIVTIAASPAIG